MSEAEVAAFVEVLTWCADQSQNGELPSVEELEELIDAVIERNQAIDDGAFS